MSRYFSSVVLPLIALAMGVFGIAHMLEGAPQLPALPPPVEPVRSPFGLSLAASGIVEPKHESIAIGSALSGIVLEVFVPAESVGKQVDEGDPLFRVDDRHLKAQLALQKANLESSKALLAKLEAMPRLEELPPIEAKVQAMAAQRLRLLDQFERSKQLFETKATTDEELTQRRLNYEEADQKLMQTKSELELLKAGAWKPEVAIAKASIAVAEAQVMQTETEINRALVTAPASGEVLQVNVRPGQAVSTQPGQALILLGDISERRVRVDIDEHDIPRFKSTAPAKAFRRGDSKTELSLRFVRLEPYVVPKKALTGDNTERTDTRVLQAIYVIENATVPVFIGQQLDVFVDTNPSHGLE